MEHFNKSYKDFAINITEYGKEELKFFKQPHFLVGFVCALQGCVFNSFEFIFSRQEMRKIIVFLYKTKSKKYLPVGAFGYSGLLISSNRICYYEKEKRVRFIRQILAKNTNLSARGVDRELKDELSYAERVKKTFLTDVVYINKYSDGFTLARKNFIRFRDFLLEKYGKIGVKTGRKGVGRKGEKGSHLFS